MESHTGQKWSIFFFFRVELHNILVEISFQLASFKSTRRESTRSVRECISTGREIFFGRECISTGRESLVGRECISTGRKFWSVEKVSVPPVGRSRISQANSAGHQAFPCSGSGVLMADFTAFSLLLIAVTCFNQLQHRMKI